MNIPTCHRCPERTRDGVRCEILVAKTSAVKGIGLLSIKFRCERRLKLFAPGECVAFQAKGYSHGYDDDRVDIAATGIVMRTKDRKVLVYSEDTFRRVVWLYPDRLNKTGATASVCRHCGRPEGKEIALGEDLEWNCRLGPVEISDNTGDYWGVAYLPCEFGDPTRG